MRPPIDGSIALVTGASSGIGAELARLLAGRARALILVARRGDRLEALRAELAARAPSTRIVVRPCDLADRAAVEGLVDEIERDVGPIDLLVNNAGLGEHALYEATEWRSTARMLAVNVDALARLSWRVLPGMVERRRGGILNVSSLMALTFVPGYAAYGGTKAFVTAFTETLRAEVRGAGVVVSQVLPGPVATEFEDVAGPFLGRRMPGWLTMSAPRCARWTLRAFGRGRALIVPGVLWTVLAALAGVAPRLVVRAAAWPIGRRLRRLRA